MGRGASKVEALEKAMEYLSHVGNPEGETTSWSIDEPRVPPHPVNHAYGRLIGKNCLFKPGLQHSPGGSVVPGLSIGSGQSCTAKQIGVERLIFRSKPSFDPMPYLDSRAQAIFQRPLEVAMCPEDVGVDPPRVRMHATAKQRRALLHKLDRRDRSFGIGGGEPDCSGYQAGLLSIMKDLSTDRMIFDSRPFNLLETPPRRWVYSAASASNLCDLQLPPGCCFATARI